jgi:hypothetical protein
MEFRDNRRPSIHKIDIFNYTMLRVENVPRVDTYRLTEPILEMFK